MRMMMDEDDDDDDDEDADANVNQLYDILTVHGACINIYIYIRDMMMISG